MLDPATTTPHRAPPPRWGRHETRFPPPRLDRLEREGLSRYFEDAWRLNVVLFSTLAPGAYYAQPDPLRHPLIFYYGHTAAFSVNKLVMAGVLPRGIRPDFEELFAKGVDPATAGDLATHELWPSVAEVHAYRTEVLATLRRLIAEHPLSEPVTRSSPLWALLMGIEHERIHFETSSVLFRQLPVDQLQRPEGWRYAPTHTPAPKRRWLPVPARRVSLGRDDALPVYGWDNEYGHESVEVPAFEATAHLVSNAEFYAFWRAGGYREERLWTKEGWAWRSRLGVTRPRFWVGDDEPRYRALFDELDMPWSWPVEVNGFEAQAFCRWVGGGARLLSEAEWASISATAPRQDDDCLAHPGYNLDLRFGSPCPVDHAPAGCTPEGLHDPYGNVWQWFRDDFRPLPGFEVHPLYKDFSEPYFDDKHAAMGGGAWASTGTSGGRWYRLWFRRHFYQHAGFRMARPLQASE